ncbi:hypothetical protein PC117_g14885 [Phytophthora cactorum]|uniref:Uncharacterized protein n=2 Tax=Phytophthora cactorum TaxID=29920 RepID=A0A8T1CKE6_9STRA|nr:hypothetical protein PC117_g14885 [Phytophthora cactorum]
MHRPPQGINNHQHQDTLRNFAMSMRAARLDLRVLAVRVALVTAMSVETLNLRATQRKHFEWRMPTPTRKRFTEN